MAFDPTPSQRLAIEAKDKTLLISAAAGAGKTATLTNRIIKSITENDPPADISRMLVVTYTRAAAADLRRKIMQAISEALVDHPTNTHLNEQAILVSSADICTIDSFCLDVVKRNFQRLEPEDGLPPVTPDLRISDGTELAAMKISVMNALIEEWYNTPPSDGINFAAFAENFEGLRDDGNLTEMLLMFEENTSHYENGKTFAHDVAKNLISAADTNEYFTSAPGKAAKEQTRDQLDYYAKMLTDAITYLTGIPNADKNYIPAFTDDLDTVNKALAALELGYGETRNVLLTYTPKSLKSLGKDNADEITDYYKVCRDKVKKGLLELAKKNYSFTPQMLADYMRLTAEQAETLGKFTDEYRRRLAHEKATRRICDFSDIKRYAHKLLVNPDKTPTEIALLLQDRYDEVYIDEYQDVDPLQDDIFAAIAKPSNRFMVGDIKQSIYGFRGSDPSIFARYRENFIPVKSEEKSEGYSIFMSDNFRCDEPIIKFSNIVSHMTFVPADGAIKYQSEDDLIHQKKEKVNTPVQLAIFRKPNPDAENVFKTESAEMRYIVHEIKKLLNTARPGKENAPKGERCFKHEDIAILVRTATIGESVAKALAVAGIPSSDVASKDYFSNPEVLLILSLLSAIDNPHRDVRLAAALRSPFFGFSMEDLVKIRRSGSRMDSLFDAIEKYEDEEKLTARCRNFEETLKALRRDAASLPLARFVRKIFSQFSVLSLELPDDVRSHAQIHENILRFYEYTRSFSEQRNGGDLSSFVKYVDDVISANIKAEKGNDRTPGKVTIMTIHKSKGLEFPVVFCCNCGSPFSKKDVEDSLLYNSESGIGMHVKDQTGYTRIEPPIYSAVKKSIVNYSREEYMRLLYVALTRAGERLYVTATLSKDNKKSFDDDLFPGKFLCRHHILSAKSFLDWLIPVSAVNDPCFELSVINAEDVPDTQLQKGDEPEENSEKRERINSLKEEFCKRIEAKYAREASLVIPAKLSVSRLKPDILESDGATDLESEKKESAESILRKPMSKPLFILESGGEKKSATPAERGTATHTFLQFCDFDRVEKSGVEAELELLIDKRFVPESMRSLVNISQLEAFFSSNFYRALKSSRRLYREQRFNLFFPASDFVNDDAPEKTELSDEKLLVQGVIDIVFEDKNGDIVLCDYKTDYLTTEELDSPQKAKKKLEDRYANQLYYYKEAVKKLFGKAPSRVCIYSLPLGDTVDINV